MSKVNTGQASSTLIPKYIGSDFDKVVSVADNIEQVVIVGDNIEDVGTVADNINYVKEVAEDLHGMPVTMYTGENPPVLNPMPEGVMWYCTTDGRTYVWYTDADSGQWVESAPQSAMKDEATNIFFHSTPSNVNPAYRNATLFSTSAPEAEISVAHNALNTPVVQAQFIREEALWVDVSVTGAQGIVTLMGYSSGNSQLKAEIIAWKNGAEGTSLGASQWVTLPRQPSVVSLPVTLTNINVLDAGDSYVVKLTSQMNAGGGAVSTILVDGNTSSRFGIISNTNLIGLNDGIRDGVTTSAPTENAVYDALQLKVGKSQLAQSGELIPVADWANVPAYSDSELGGLGGPLNAQANALTARSELLLTDVREALRRSYAEAGYNLVDGSFEAGGTVAYANDVLLYEATGVAYSYSGTLPHTVGAGETPVGNPLWVSVALKSLRADIQVANYTALRAYTGTLKSVYVTGVIGTEKPDGEAGSFVLDASDTTSADNGGTIIVGTDGRRWKRVYAGHAMATWFGARPDGGITNNAPIINAALAAVKYVALPYGGSSSAYYGILSPIYMDTEQSLIGLGARLVEIRKTTNTLGVGSNTMSAVTDSYVKDAVLILRHANNAYNNYPRLNNLLLNGIGGATGCDYCVYAPRVAHGMFEGVIAGVSTGLYGWVTHDTYLTKFDGVQTSKSFVARAGSIGFWWDDLNDGSSGTSCEFSNCWARDGFDIGWKLRGLVYSSISSCGTDRFGTHAFWAELCDLSIDTMGFENRLAGSVGSPITLRYGRYNIGVLVGFSVDVAAGDYVMNIQGGSVELSSIRHVSLSGSAGKSFRVADSASLVIGGDTVFGSGIITTPDIEAGSSINDLTAPYKSGTWVPVIAGVTTAGTYELSTASGKYTRIGNQVTLQCYMQLAAAVTGGGAGAVRITGLPFAKANNATVPVGAVQLNGVNFTGSVPAVAFVTSVASSTLYFPVNTPNSPPGQVQVTDLAANNIISFTITYDVG